MLFEVDEVSISVPPPENWESYETVYGLVLAEYIDSVARDGRLGGLLVHIFVPPLEDLSIPAVDGANNAWLVLSEIIENPDYVGSATVSEPVAFEWDGLDAAYYLMDNGEGNATIVVGVMVPGSNRLVACSVSAPLSQADRLREQLPALLDGLTIEDLRLDGDELDSLPDPLNFPKREGTNQEPTRVS